jgi:hypothetical protein
MANVIGGGTGRFLTDDTGDPIDATNRLPVETEQDDAFSTFVSYPTFTAHTTVEALNGSNHLNIANVADAKEILIQTDDANTSYIMVGSSADTTVANAAVANRKGIKLNGGETLVLAIASLAAIFIHTTEASQYVNVSYFK